MTAFDHSSNDDFGWSVSLDNLFLAVGAPSKKVNGNPEQQALTCNGPPTNGTFTIQFRGYTSQTIKYNSTVQDILNAILGPYGNTSNIHPLPAIKVEAIGVWEEKGDFFCKKHGNKVLITFLTPDGGLSTKTFTRSDVEMLEVVNSMTNGSVSVSEIRKGTRSLSGSTFDYKNVTGQQSGSVYLFKRNIACEFCSYSWDLVKKFTTIDGLKFPVDSANFGWSVTTKPATDNVNQVLVVGSPGSNHAAGSVYIFRGHNESWNFENILTNSVWEPSKKGDKFGYVVNMEGDTILIGAPGYKAEQGIVYVFRQGTLEMGFLSSQAIHGPDELQPGDNFGHSVSLSGNNVVICAPNKDDDVIYGRTKDYQTMKDVGACYVYSRKNESCDFKYLQKLIGSNLKPRDRFGLSTSISGLRIAVGQLEDFHGDLVPPRPVQVLTIYCSTNPCRENLGSTFRLSWRDMSKVTTSLPISASANRLKASLQKDLDIGDVSVSKTERSVYDGGYTWYITFNSFGVYSKPTNKIPTLKCDVSEVTGTNPACSVVIKHDTPKNIRSKVHLFKYTNNIWTEQSFLFPSNPQKQDKYGTTVAIDGDFAIVGAPNRALLNVNSGSAMAHDISFLDFQFESSSYTIKEGSPLSIEFSRSSRLDEARIISFRSIDKNAELSLQNKLSRSYIIYDHPNYFHLKNFD